VVVSYPVVTLPAEAVQPVTWEQGMAHGGWVEVQRWHDFRDAAWALDVLVSTAVEEAIQETGG